jgi:hypothetical protein
MSPPTTSPELSTLAIRDRVWSQNAQAQLTVVGLSYGHVPAESVLSGEAKPIQAMLSSDGRHFDLTAWHDGEITSQVYVERHTPAGCDFHGLIDAHTRRITQAG